jgi:hypothetical protein
MSAVKNGGKVRAIVLSLLMSAAGAGQTPAQTPSPERDAVLAVVDRFMLAISSNDVAALARLRLPGGSDIVERPRRGGGTDVGRRPFDASAFKGGDYRERYWDPVVLVRGRIAVVWTPYEFWQGGKTSHCGIDVFELVREGDEWRIANMMWTVEPDGCAGLRPSDPSRMRPAQ